MEEHNLILDLRSHFNPKIGTKKLSQKIYVVYEDIAYEYIVVPKSVNMESNTNDYIFLSDSLGTTITDMECTFYIDHYRVIDIKDVPFDGVIVNQKVIEKIIEKEKIVKEYYNIYSFIS